MLRSSFPWLWPDQSPSPCRWKTSPQHDAATTMLYHRDGIGQEMSGAWFLPDMMFGIQAKEFSLDFNRSENLVSHSQSESPFGKLQPGCHVPFTEKWLPSGHSTIKAWLVECCRYGCSSGRFSYRHRGTQELRQSDHRVLGHLRDQGPSLPIAQFGWAASSRKSLGGSKLLPFKNDEGCCALGDIQWYINVLVPFPQICALTKSCLWALWTIPSTSWLGFCSDMHCQQCDLI